MIIYEEEYNKGVEKINNFLQLPDIEDTKEETSLYFLSNILEKYFNPFFQTFSEDPITIKYGYSKYEVRMFPYYPSSLDLRLFIKLKNTNMLCVKPIKCFVLKKEYGYSPIYYNNDHYYEMLRLDNKQNSSDYDKELIDFVVFDQKDRIEKMFKKMEQYHTWCYDLGLSYSNKKEEEYDFRNSHILTIRYMDLWAGLFINGNGNIEYSLKFDDSILEKIAKAKRLDGKDSLWSLLDKNKEAIAKKMLVNIYRLRSDIEKLYQIYYSSFDRIEDNTPKTYQLS